MSGNDAYIIGANKLHQQSSLVCVKVGEQKQEISHQINTFLLEKRMIKHV